MPPQASPEFKIPMMDLREADLAGVFSPIEPESNGPTRSLRGLVNVGLSVIAGMGGGMVSSAEALAADPVTSKAANLYTRIQPADAVQKAQTETLTDTGVIARSFSLKAGTLGVQGDCEAGSTYKLWLDTPSQLQQEKCDGSPPTTNSYGAERDYQALETRFQTNLNRIGSFLVNSIPGNSVEFKQTTTSVEGSTTGPIKANFVCPNPKASPAAKVNFQSIELMPGNNLNATFCPSSKIINFSALNRNDPAYPQAIGQYGNDKFRNTPWWGDFWRKDLYEVCPMTPKQQDPQMTFKLNKAKGSVSVNYDSGGGTYYCDETGQFVEEISVQAKRSGGKYKRVGNSVLHITGLPETLTYMYGSPLKYLRERVSVPNVGDICNGSNTSNTQLRVKITETFTPNKKQTFQHGYQDRTDLMRSGTATYTTRPKKVC